MVGLTVKGKEYDESSGQLYVREFRYETSGYPAVAAIRHCIYCQLRTGLAFGTFVYLLENILSLTSGSWKFSILCVKVGKNGKLALAVNVEQL